MQQSFQGLHLYQIFREMQDLRMGNGKTNHRERSEKFVDALRLPVRVRRLPAFAKRPGGNLKAFQERGHREIRVWEVFA
jgi:hypothetical protein